jgi:hypothetical protein
MSRLPPTLGLLELFLLFDAAFNWRWALHGLLANAAMEQHLYGERKLPQELVLGLLVVATIVAMALTLRYFGGRWGACLSICGALISAVFWLTEVISLHATDAILERSLGPYKLVALVWIATSAMTAVGILQDMKRRA